MAMMTEMHALTERVESMLRDTLEKDKV